MIMRYALLFFVCSCFPASASVRELVAVYQPISYHGTDTVTQVGEDFVQAGIMSTPIVVTGAMPEVLVQAVGMPHRMVRVGDYPFEENNLLALCQIKVGAEMEETQLTVVFDLSSLKIPEEVDLSARKVLELGIQAVKRTLKVYYVEAQQKTPYRIQIIGTKEDNASLKDLGGLVK